MKIKQYVQFVMKLVIVWDFKNYRKLNEFSKDGLHWLIRIILFFLIPTPYLFYVRV